MHSFRFFKILPTRISCIVSYFVPHCVFLCRFTYSSRSHLFAFAKIPINYSFLVGGMSPVPVTRVIMPPSSIMTRVSRLSPSFNSSSSFPQDSTHHHILRIQLIIILPGFNSSSYSSSSQASTHHHFATSIQSTFPYQPPRPSQVPPRLFQRNLMSSIQASSIFIFHELPSNFPAESDKFRSQIPVRLQQRRAVGTPATPLRIATSVRLLEIDIRPNNF